METRNFKTSFNLKRVREDSGLMKPEIQTSDRRTIPRSMHDVCKTFWTRSSMDDARLLKTDLRCPMHVGSRLSTVDARLFNRPSIPGARCTFQETRPSMFDAFTSCDRRSSTFDAHKRSDRRPKFWISGYNLFSSAFNFFFAFTTHYVQGIWKVRIN